MSETKVCSICGQTFARKVADTRRRSPNDGWRQRLICYATPCALALKKVRSERSQERRRKAKPKPKRQSTAELYGDRRYEDDPRATRSTR